jgi:hypothetical protein
LPAEIAFVDQLTRIQVGFGYQNLGCGQWRGRWRWRRLWRRRTVAARQHGGEATGSERDDQNDDAGAPHFR